MVGLRSACPIYESVFVNRLSMFFSMLIGVGASTSGCGLNHLFGIGDKPPSP